MANDLNLLARVFIRYRSGLDTNYPECQEIIALLNGAGLDVMHMSNPDILAAFAHERGGETPPEKPRGRRMISPAKRAHVASGDEITAVEEIEPTDESSEENEE